MRGKATLGSRNWNRTSLLCLMLLPGLTGQAPSSPQDRPAEPFTIKVNVDSIVLHTTVRNRKGTLVSGLRQGDFHVYEDGGPQQITFFAHEDIPLTVGLVIDVSGSMRPKRSDVIAAALAFVRNSNSQDQMFVINFNEHVSFGLPSNKPFTDQPAELEAALVHRPNGQTALYDAIVLGLEHLKKGDRDKRVLIVISDGGDNASRYQLSQVMALAKQTDATIYTVGLFESGDPDSNPRVLKQLAETSGGESFFPELFRDVVPICERIARDIRSQYTLVYTPSNAKQDGSYRLIQVAVEPPDRRRLLVRTRAGYKAPGEPRPPAPVDRKQP